MYWQQHFRSNHILFKQRKQEKEQHLLEYHLILWFVIVDNPSAKMPSETRTPAPCATLSTRGRLCEAGRRDLPHPHT